jgi:PAS domain S-box-containing protein
MERSTIGTPVEHWDLATVVKISQAVSGEIDLHKLIDTLMVIALEHAGGDRGLLILPRGDELQIEAEARTGRDTVEVRLGQTRVVSAELPESVLRYVVRTQDSVLLDDASLPNQFSADVYIGQKHCRSVLCLPLVKQSKLIGVLYLENNLTPHVFTPARLALLKLLASQAAISLENAHLYTELQQSEDHLRLAIDTIPMMVGIARPDGSSYFLNQRWLEYTGLSLEQGRGQGWQAAIHPEDLSRFVDEWRAALAAGDPLETEARVQRADGEYRWFLIRTVPLRDDKGNIVKWYGTGTDIEDRKQAEEIRAAQARQAGVRADVSAALSQPAHSGEFLCGSAEAIVRHLDAAFARIWTLNKENNMLELQASAGMYTHLDGPHSRIPVGKSKIGLIAEEKKPHLTNDVMNDPRVTDKVWAQNEGMVSFAGYPLIVQNRVVGVMAMFARQRLTAATLDTLASVADSIAQGIERKRAEDALRKAQGELAHVTRVTTMGELTASIAHEVNQPLSAIVTNGNACLRWLAGNSPNFDEAREAARRIIRDGNRASDVIGRIRALVKKGDTEKAPLDINEAIQEIVSLTHSEIQKSGVVLEMNLAGGLPPILGDRIQLQQVILNLVMNGIEAMNTVTDRPRKLLIRSSQHESDKVLVAVQDSGVGINSQNIEKIFDTFYTTKSQGMGMGLAISRSIVENHGGRLWVVPNEGPGATFQFTLLK